MRTMWGMLAGAAVATAGWLAAPGQAQAQWQGAYTTGGLVECNSYDDRPQVCPIDNRSGQVRVWRQISQTPCIEGQTYRVTRNAIEVRRGCRAIFAVDTGNWGGGGWGEQGNYQTVRCESRDGRRRTCPMDTRNGVRLERELSSTPCIRGRSWGFDRNGVWVDRGCRGEFASFGGWGGSGGSWGGSGGGWGGSGGSGGNRPPGGGWGGSGGSIENYTQRVDCYSLRGGMRNVCYMPNARNATLFQQLQGNRCVRGRTWGIERDDAIWVDQGCNGRFVAP